MMNIFSGKRAAPATAVQLSGKVDKISTPFPTPHIYPVDATMTHHLGFDQALIFENTTTGLWTFVYRRAPAHADDLGATGKVATVIEAADSYDHGQTLFNRRAVLTGNGTNLDYTIACGRVMASGRWGFIARQIDGGTDPQPAPVFVYSDNNGTSWSTVALSLTTGTGSLDEADFNSVVYGPMLEYPTSVGGDDTNGFIFYCYSQDKIAYATTVDNGATWSEVTEALDGGARTLTEFDVARVGSEDKWIMVIRGEPSIAFSTDMTTWTGLTDFPLDFKGNAPRIIQEDGSETFHFLVASRRNSVIETGLRSHLLIYECDAGTLYDTSGASGVGSYTVLGLLPDWATGYGGVYKLNGHWYATVNAGENIPTGRANILGMVSNHAPMVSTPTSARQMLSQAGWNPGGNMQVWTGYSGAITGTSGRIEGADNWAWRRTGSATGYTISRVDGSSVGYAQRVARDSANSSTAKINGLNILDPNDVLYLRGKLVNVVMRARRGADYSATSNNLLVYLFAYDTDTDISTTDGSLAGAEQLGLITAALTTSWQEFTLSAVRIPTNASMAFLRVDYSPTGTAGANDWFEMEQVRVIDGPVAVPFQPLPYSIEKARVDGMPTVWT